MAPIASAVSTSTGIGIEGMDALSMAVHMPVSARLDAIDRSIQRVNMTAIWPSAKMINIDVSLNTPSSDAGDANAGKRR